MKFLISYSGGSVVRSSTDMTLVSPWFGGSGDLGNIGEVFG